MFIVRLNYIQPIESIEAALENHRAFLRKYYDSGHFVLSGPLVPRTGGIILVTADSKAALDEILSQDPFDRLGLAEYVVQEFTPTMASTPLKALAAL